MKIIRFNHYQESISFEERCLKILCFRGTLDLKVTFNRMGTAIASGVIYIQSEQQKYKVTVYIGKGKFRIEKV